MASIEKMVRSLPRKASTPQRTYLWGLGGASLAGLASDGFRASAFKVASKRRSELSALLARAASRNFWIWDFDDVLAMSCPI